MIDMSVAVSSSPKKYILLVLPLILLAVGLNQIGWQVAVSLALFCIFYVTLNRFAWVLLVLAPLGLLLGSVLHIEIRPNWLYDMSIGEVFVMTSFLSLFLDVLFGIRSTLRISLLGWILVLYVIAALCSVFYVSDYPLFVAGMKVLVLSIMSYLSALNLFDTKSKIKTFCSSLVIFTAVLSLQIFYLFFKSGFSPAIFFDRSSIVFPFGALALVTASIAFLVPLLFSLSLHYKHTEKISFFSALVAIIGVVAVFASLGKAAALSLVIGLILLFWHFKQQRIIMALLVLFFVITSVSFLSPYVQGFWERLARISIDSTTSFRIEEYEVAARLILDNPVKGLGIGEQLNQYQRLLHPDYSELANNYFLQAGMDLGFIGITILAFIILLILGLAVKLNKLRTLPIASGLAISIIIALVNGLFEVTIFALQYAIIFWLVVGMSSRIRKDKLLYEPKS